MGYSSEICRKALDIRKSQVREKTKAYEQKLQSVYDSVPELSQIEAQQKNLGSRIIASAMSGNPEALEPLKLLAKELEERKQSILADAGIGENEFLKFFG